MAIVAQVTLNNKALLEVDANPTISGVTASLGSIATWDTGTTGRMFLKIGAADTAWSEILSNNSLSLASQEVTGTSSITTTSNSFVLMTGMTITPPAGQYLVLFSSSFDTSTADAGVFISLYVGGVYKADSDRRGTPRSTTGLATAVMAHNVGTHGIVTTTGVEAVEGRWRTASGTATAYQRTMTLIKTSP